ncbi:sigma-54 dependent transcriptional regulator [Sphingomonas sp.]|uniref:sigma-54-dependent transcriptional regulator n=1 Tax=Sphingomonas sp. TaxID=28214 RepID=UPI00289CBC42|nr:sigma-54 dependent transcriptional regulator [Sphingomonas sp.]
MSDSDTTPAMRVLLVDDDTVLRQALAQSFELAGIDVEAHGDPLTALGAITPDFPGMVVSDIRMPGIDGIELARRVAGIDAEIPVILMTGHGDVPMAVAALKQGVFDFVAKPFAADLLIASAGRALETRRLVLDNRRLRTAAEEAQGAYPLIGETPVMMRLRETVRQVAQADVDVLVEGETGTGKELVALLLHRWSARRTRPFIAVDCAALPEAIAENELFGQAHARTPGRIAAAHRGTLFLDEVDSMAPALQGRMLRVVEEREVRAIGSEDPQLLDLRIVAAAKSDLGRAVEEGRFRADLLYRLDAVRLRVPPLRERRADVPLLFAHFLREAAERFGRPVPLIDGGVQARLLSHDWPGNVREVRNYANRVALGLAGGLSGEGAQAGDSLSLPERVERFEGATIRAVLEEVAGDVRAALAVLGIPRKTFYDKVARHGIDLNAYRPNRA